MKAKKKRLRREREEDKHEDHDEHHHHGPDADATTMLADDVATVETTSTNLAAQFNSAERSTVVDGTLMQFNLIILAGVSLLLGGGLFVHKGMMARQTEEQMGYYEALL